MVRFITSIANSFKCQSLWKVETLIKNYFEKITCLKFLEIINDTLGACWVGFILLGILFWYILLFCNIKCFGNIFCSICKLFICCLFQMFFLNKKLFWLFFADSTSFVPRNILLSSLFVFSNCYLFFIKYLECYIYAFAMRLRLWNATSNARVYLDLQ